jgi:two-component system chemotaxis sensor kinase CheA
VHATPYADLFRSESREQLSVINRTLLALEARPGDTASVHELFRAVHSLKGMSASMGYAGLTSVAHEMEELLERVRSGALPVREGLADALFAAADALEAGVECALAGADEPPALSEALTRLRAWDGAAPSRSGAARASASRAAVTAESADRGDVEATDDERVDEGPGVLVRVRQRSGTDFPGVAAIMVLQRARVLGDLVAVSPPIAVLQAAEISQAFAFRLLTTAPPAEIEAAVRSVGSVEQVRVIAGRGRYRTPLRVTPVEAPADALTATRYARVEISRLDRLVNQIGELVEAGGHLQGLTAARGDAALDAAMARVSRLIGALHNEVMSSRLLPAWQLLDRFPRLVRDAARQLGKSIEFRLEGRELELDRLILDELAEPVVHLLRNAVDHGVEPPETREALGKPRAGLVTLRVARDGSAVVVSVRDDGRGIDRGQVLARARAKGLVGPEVVELDDAALLRVLVTPGFTLAASVSDLSGRGVGLDAVHARVNQLGGSLAVASVPGAGTTVTIRF